MDLGPRNSSTGTSREVFEGIVKKNANEPRADPPGFNFAPKDHELIINYLNPKINNETVPYHAFRDVVLYDHSPEELVETHKLRRNERIYFFTPRSRKYPNGRRPARAAGRGRWKATGSEKKIFHGSKKVGAKRTLVYYEGKASNKNNGIKTDWAMHEYVSDLSSSSLGKPKPAASIMKLDDWVLCCIHKRRGAINKSKGLVTISHAQSGMSSEQAVNTTQNYQTTIDRNDGSSDAIVAQPLTAAPSEQMRVSHAQSGMPTEQAANTTQSHQMTSNSNSGYSSDAIMAQPIAAVDAGFSHANVAQPLPVVPDEQMMDFNGMVQPSTVAYGEPMANFDGTVQTLARAPSEPMIDFQPRAELHCLAPIILSAPGEPMNDFNGVAQPCLGPSNELITSFIKMAQPFLEAQLELDRVAQTSAMVPREPQPFSVAPSELMSSVNGTMQPHAMGSNVLGIIDNGTLLPPGAVSGQQIVDFDATLQRSPSIPMAELDRAMSICMNHSTRQDFQQNSGNAMDQYGMGHGELEQPPLMHHYQQEMRTRVPPLMHHYQQRMRMELPPLMHDHQQGMNDHQQGIGMELPPLMHNHQQEMGMHDHQQGIGMELSPLMHDHQQEIGMELPLLMHDHQQGMGIHDHQQGIGMELSPLMHDHQQGIGMHDRQQGIGMELPPLMYDHQQRMGMEPSSHMHDYRQEGR